MDDFELEDNLELLLQSIQELIEDQGENNPFGAANHDELIASLLHNNQENPLTDVSVEDVRDGKDMQGIPWEKIVFRRDQYREMKMKNYRNYQNLSYAREEALKMNFVAVVCSDQTSHGRLHTTIKPARDWDDETKRLSARFTRLPRHWKRRYLVSPWTAMKLKRIVLTTISSTTQGVLAHQLYIFS